MLIWWALCLGASTGGGKEKKIEMGGGMENILYPGIGKQTGRHEKLQL